MGDRSIGQILVRILLEFIWSAVCLTGFVLVADQLELINIQFAFDFWMILKLTILYFGIGLVVGSVFFVGIVLVALLIMAAAYIDK